MKYTCIGSILCDFSLYIAYRKQANPLLNQIYFYFLQLYSVVHLSLHPGKGNAVTRLFFVSI